jgi:hypothetical protein
MKATYYTKTVDALRNTILLFWRNLFGIEKDSRPYGECIDSEFSLVSQPLQGLGKSPEPPHPLDSEAELWDQNYHLCKLVDKSNNQYAYFRRSIDWLPEDFFRPSYFSEGLEYGRDGSTRAGELGTWIDVTDKILSSVDRGGLSSSE